MDRAAALSYYFLFALFPALLFITALLGFLPLQELQDRLMSYLSTVLPPDAAGTVERTLSHVLERQRGGLLSLGALIALWAGSNGMASVISALNIAYDVEDLRPWWKRRLLAVVLTVTFSVFIIATLALLVFGPRLGAALAGWLGFGQLFNTLWSVISLPVVLLCALLAVTLVYYLAPATRERWRWITPGAVLALLLFLALSWGLRLYVQYFGNYNATYGSIGGVILLMLWFYLSSVVLLLGAEVNAEIEKAAREHGATTAAPASDQAA